MPELAEVETVRNVLKEKILNKRIKDVKIYYDKMIECDLKYFKENLINKSFKDILRIGKWLIFETEDKYLLSHLRMEGKYFIKNVNDALSKHEHVVFIFSDNSTLTYNDTRKFGTMNLINKEDLYNISSIKKQGYEPSDKRLTSLYLLEKFKNKKISIKSALLDQSIISGLGNIYVNEVLFYAKINPLREAKNITEKECDLIIKGSRGIISEAIKMGGTTIKSYTSSLGVSGRYQEKLMVHKKEGEPCKICNSKIVNIDIGGRSTYYCKNCQK